jgi:L-amino acid N-acyltransferase YncA
VEVPLLRADCYWDDWLFPIAIDHAPVMTIIPATNKHSNEIWEIFRRVVQAGDTYVFDPDISRQEALRYWLSPDHHVFVVTDMEQVFGAYILRKNYPGRGSHVANASYMVCPEARGNGLGSLMCQHSVEEARRLGFSAIQFNMVVSTNSGWPDPRKGDVT